MDREGLEGVKVGDTLLRFLNYGHRRREPEEVTVTKVGRKLIHVLDGHYCNQYRIDTGVIHDSYGHTFLRTREQHERSVLRSDVVKRLRIAGMDLNRDGSGISTKKLEEILEVLQK